MRRATPSARAAALTAFAIAGTTAASNTDGRMYSAERRGAGTLSASAAAAAGPTFGVTGRARVVRPELFGERALLAVEVGPRGRDRAVTVGDDDLVRARRSQQPRRRDAGGAGSKDDHPELVERDAAHGGRVAEAGEDRDRRSVLVIVEYRNVEAFTQ